MADFEKQVMALSAEKRHLLEERLLKQRRVQPVDVIPKTPVSANKRYPTTAIQEQIWVLDHNFSAGAAYHMSGAFRLMGELSPTALQNAIDTIVARHAILRTAFSYEAGQLYQSISESRIPLQHITLPAEIAEATLQQRLATIAAAPFDLSRAPLMRLHLLKLGDVDHILLIVVHHIVCDGLSVDIFWRELAQLYQSYIDSAPSPLPTLPIQYADFAVWESEQATQPARQKQLAYWKKHLSDAPHVINLPHDYSRPSVQSFRGARIACELPADTVRALEQLGRENDATLYMVMLAAFKLLLHRYCRQEDIVVGVPVANRGRTELHSLIGLFANTVAIRSHVTPNLTFQQLVQHVRENAFNAYTNQAVPLSEVIAALNVPRDPSYTPLFQLLFQLQNRPATANTLGPLAVQPLELDHATAQLDLSVDLGWRGDRFIASFEYSTDLFAHTTIERLIGHYGQLLNSIVACPSAHIADLPMLTPPESVQLIETWNKTADVTTPLDSIHRLFERRVADNPAAIAVVHGNQTLTYEALNQRANQLAHVLTARAVGAEDVVGIYLDRSLEMMVALLGVLKAGGAFLIIDPSYPRERVQYLLRDADVKLLLSRQDVDVPVGNRPILHLDTHESQLAAAPTDNLTDRCVPDNAAYLIYTSGSTGRPKGVVVPHRALANHSDAFAKRMNLTGADCVLQFAMLSFDVTLEEIFPTLLAGATLVLPEQKLIAPNRDFLALLHATNITVANLPATYAQAWVHSLVRLQMKPPPSLRLLIVGSEPVLPAFVQSWQLATDAKIAWMNAYGTTETTITSIVFTPPARLEHSPNYQAVPIGSPMANIQTYLLDSQMRPVPIGIPGEIYIGGAAVSRGYHHRPAETARAFVPDPFSQRMGARLYKTGDLGKYTAAGAIVHLGRVDEQIKIRGFRIEPGEIESVIQMHEAVDEAVVVRRESSGDAQLAAYLTTKSGAESAFVHEIEAAWFDENRAHNKAEQQGDSSYMGRLMSRADADIWAIKTAERIQQLGGGRVLEIACDGMLLPHLAPHCTAYWGVTASKKRVANLRQATQHLSHVQVTQLSATTLSALSGQTFDTIIVNAAVQFFPSVAYLTTVLAQAVDLLAEQGRIFIANVNCLNLLTEQHTTAAVAQASASALCEQLNDQIEHAIMEERRLFIAPTFFHKLLEQFPKLKQLSIQLCRGQASKYSYDVILSSAAVAAHPPPRWLSWEAVGPTITDLAQLMRGERIAIQNIPNARLQRDVQYVAHLATASSGTTVGQLLSSLPTAEEGIDPEAWWAAAERDHHSISISWSATYDKYDVVIDPQPGRPLFASTVHLATPSHVDANNPVVATLAERLIPAVQTHLRAELPAYMMPTTITVLPTFPRTPNGKLNKRALPAPQQVSRQPKQLLATPTTKLEETIWAVWKDVLQRDGFGMQDNFFELGGHSILLAEVHSRLNEALGMQLNIVDLLQYPTITAFAAYLSPQKQDEKPSTGQARGKSRKSTAQAQRNRVRRRRLRNNR